MKKKITALIAAALMAFTAVGAAACGNKNHDPNPNPPISDNTNTDGGNTDNTDKNPDDNTDNDDNDDDKNNDTDTDGEAFVGALSSEKYNSAAAAMKAFINDEIVVYDLDFDLYTGHVLGSELTGGDIDKLNIPAAQKANIKSVKRATVKYMMMDFSRAITEKQVKCLLVEYKDGKFGYYVVAPETGDVLSQSYLNAVFDLDLYKNSKVFAVEKANCYGDDIEGRPATEGGALVSEETAYIYDGIMRVDLKLYGSYGDEGEVERETAYYKKSGDTHFRYEEGDYTGDDPYLVDWNQWDYSERVYSYIDFTESREFPAICFTKTEKGFEANDVYWMAYNEILFVDREFDPVEGSLTQKCEFTVSSGKITHALLEEKWKQPRGQATKDSYNIKEVTISAVDKQQSETIAQTVVDKMDELKAEIDEIIEDNKQYYKLPALAPDLSSQRVDSASQWEAAFDYSEMTNATIESIDINKSNYELRNYKSIFKCVGENSEYYSKDVTIHEDNILNRHVVEGTTDYTNGDRTVQIEMQSFCNALASRYTEFTYEEDGNGNGRYVGYYDENETMLCTIKIVGGKAVYIELSISDTYAACTYIYDIGTTVIG